MVPHYDPPVAVPDGEVSGFSQKAPQGVAAFFRVETTRDRHDESNRRHHRSRCLTAP